jgi:hypothetical protein
MSLFMPIGSAEKPRPNQSRGCVKAHDNKFGNDLFYDMENFYETNRRIQWSKNEFSHSLSPEPITAAAPVANYAMNRLRLNFFR